MAHFTVSSELTSRAAQPAPAQTEGNMPWTTCSSNGCSAMRHQVKPWFEGKLDFAPEVPALEDTELRLRGGSVGYVFDGRAAVLVYALRQHLVTLLVFRTKGLPWPDASGGQVGLARGFNVVLWRGGELGYSLVSDANANELGEIGVRLAAAVHSPGP